MTLLKTLRQATLAVSLCRRHPAVSKKNKCLWSKLGVWNDKGYQPKLGICIECFGSKTNLVSCRIPLICYEIWHVSIIFTEFFCFFRSFPISNHLIEASPQTLQVCQGQRRPWEKLPANGGAETFNRVQPLKNLIFIEFFGEFIYSWHKIHWEKKTNTWASTMKCPCSTGWFDKHLTETYCNTNFQSSKTNNSIQIQHVYCKQPIP